MFTKLEKLYLKRLELNSKRLKKLEKIRGRGYLLSVKTLLRIQVILQKEIQLNKKIIQLLEEQKEEEFIEQIAFNFKKLNKILLREEKLIAKLNNLEVVLSYLRVLYGKKDIYSETWSKVKNYTRQEARINQEILNLSSSLPKGYQIDKNKFKKSWQLVLELQRELKKLAKNVGNAKLVKVHAEKILGIVSLLQKTELYDYIQQDVLWIKKKAKYMVEHPGESKVAYALATFYIVSPGTFEATGVVLFFRYLGKYTISNSKKIKKRISRA